MTRFTWNLIKNLIKGFGVDLEENKNTQNSDRINQLLEYSKNSPSTLLVPPLLRNAQGTPLYLGNQESYHRSDDVKTTANNSEYKNNLSKKI